MQPSALDGVSGQWREIRTEELRNVTNNTFGTLRASSYTFKTQSLIVFGQQRLSNCTAITLYYNICNDSKITLRDKNVLHGFVDTFKYCYFVAPHEKTVILFCICMLSHYYLPIWL